eukprot:364392-Chlamydomonas_euryale.AAC.5
MRARVLWRRARAHLPIRAHPHALAEAPLSRTPFSGPCSASPSRTPLSGTNSACPSCTPLSGTNSASPSRVHLPLTGTRSVRFFPFPPPLVRHPFVPAPSVSAFSRRLGGAPSVDHPLPVSPCRLLPSRYVQWSCTTPTMLFTISKISDFNDAEVAFTMAADFVMIVTGFVSAMTPPGVMSVVFVNTSFIAFYIVLYQLYRMLASAMSEASSAHARNGLNITLVSSAVIWHLFPLGWCLARMGPSVEWLGEPLQLTANFGAKVRQPGAAMRKCRGASRAWGRRSSGSGSRCS